MDKPLRTVSQRKRRSTNPMDNRNERAADNREPCEKFLVLWPINLKGNLKISKEIQKQYKR